MGRGHESEVRVNDISVSRCHALMKYQNGTDDRKGRGGFCMEDNLSKFGTLILAKKKTIDLEPDMTKAVQIGRSVISFTVKEMLQNERNASPESPNPALKSLSPHQLPQET